MLYFHLVSAFQLIFKDGNVLLNDELDTFFFMVIWYRIYGLRPLRKTGNLLLSLQALFPQTG